VLTGDDATCAGTVKARRSLARRTLVEAAAALPSVPMSLAPAARELGFASAKCVVTGGLGFIGSNLVHALLDQGAGVHVIDARIPDHGADDANLAGLDVALLVASIDDPAVADVCADASYIFNVAGQVSHVASMRDPQRDLLLNATSHAAFLETVRSVSPQARLVYTSTRQVYGRPVRVPVDESHPTHPVDVNGVAKLAGEQLHMVYGHVYDLAVTSLRLTNVYGPRQRLTSDELGFLPVFLRRAMCDEVIEIFGDGSQRRDCLHVDDVVDALLFAARDDNAIGEIYNVGSPIDQSLREIAELIVELSGSSGGIQLTPWPADHAKIDVGSVHVDASKIEALGWTSRIDMRTGLGRTIDFYREFPWYLSSI